MTNKRRDRRLSRKAKQHLSGDEGFRKLNLASPEHLKSGSADWDSPGLQHMAGKRRRHTRRVDEQRYESPYDDELDEVWIDSWTDEDVDVDEWDDDSEWE